MVTCIVIAGIISMLSIFVFFGDAFSNTGGTIIPNMFHLMFGGTSNYSGTIIVWPQFGWLTFLFVLQILIMLISIIGFFVCYNIQANGSGKDGGVAISVIHSFLSTIAFLISFCTLAITEVNRGGYNVHLGFGPVFYSVVHIVVVGLLILGIILKNREEVLTHNRYVAAHSPARTVSTKPASAKSNLSEMEKADLILKYKKMWDDGVITQEEFEKKKKELL